MMKTYAREVKKSQIYALVFIVYTVFCTTFIDGTLCGHEQHRLGILPTNTHCSCSHGLAWFSLKVLFPNKPKLRVMDCLECTDKTISVGAPLINAMYEDGNVGWTTIAHVASPTIGGRVDISTTTIPICGE
jgi:sodium/bile acid cotransporter 7